MSPRRSRSPSYDRNGGRRATRSISRSPSPAVKSTKIVVERLTKNINENHLRELFGSFGEIIDMDMPMNRQFGTNRGTAYLLYAVEADADQAIAHMHEAQLDGAVISVSIVIPRRNTNGCSRPTTTKASIAKQKLQQRCSVGYLSTTVIVEVSFAKTAQEPFQNLLIQVKIPEEARWEAR
ncbi:hypothetical protein VE02_07647 [Pseudogymnoascus sp. 03VT05]|nr:hypothetical protein VE02_07647 [Pseudogymnoascus sp. 03VT05]